MDEAGGERGEREGEEGLREVQLGRGRGGERELGRQIKWMEGREGVRLTGRDRQEDM